MPLPGRAATSARREPPIRRPPPERCARANRCRSPPDRAPAGRSARPSSPNASSRPSSSLSNGSDRIARTRSMLSMTLCWSANAGVCGAHPNEGESRSTTPRVGWLTPSTIERTLVLPDPDRPVMTVSCPRRKLHGDRADRGRLEVDLRLADADRKVVRDLLAARCPNAKVTPLAADATGPDRPG